MKRFSLGDNALFLSCWHERARLVPLVCIGALYGAGFLLLHLSMALDQMKDPVAVWKASLYGLFFMQGLLLLIQGTLFAAQMAGRECTSGTLDFHRSSPELAWQKAVGLILGSTWFEWLAFFFLFFCEGMVAVFLPGVKVWTVCLFNLSLALTGVFFHTAAVSLALSFRGKISAGFLFLLLFFVFPGWFVFIHLGVFLIHLFGFSVFSLFVPENFPVKSGFLYWELPSLVLQGMIQIPMALLFLGSTVRVFRFANSPAWSKPQIVLLGLFLIFVHNAFNVGEKIYPQINNSWTWMSAEDRALKSWIFFLGMGLCLSFSLSPTYFKCSKNIVLRAKGKIARTRFWDDGATGFGPLGVFVGSSILFFLGSQGSLGIPLAKGALALVLVSSYSFTFCGFLEYFRLSRFRQKKMFFVTGLLLAWVFCPWLSGIVSGARDRDPLLISPFAGFSFVLDFLTNRIFLNGMLASLTFPVCCAGLTWFLAWREHRTVQRRVENDLSRVPGAGAGHRAADAVMS